MKRRCAALLAVMLAFASSATPAPAPEDGFVLLVNVANPGTQIKRETVAAVFLKKLTRWSDGTQITPVDQSATSPVRKAFTEAVWKQPVAFIQNQWMQQIQTARTAPPPVKNSDAEVAAHVARDAGGIGYVSPDFAAPAGTKVLRLAE